MTWTWLDNFLWFVVAMIAIVQLSAISQQLAKIREELSNQLKVDHMTFPRGDPGDPPHPD